MSREERESDMFDIKENLKKLPDAPGVYMHKDNLGNIIYVGKAISLKNRVRQYFQSKKNMDAKVKAMVGHIDEFEYIRCDSEMEALILENNLIKKYKPKYNILLRDDKTYPYIKITGESWPRIEKTRRVLKDGGKYFGPYTDVGAVNSMVDLLNQVYKLKKCAVKNFPEGFKPCLNYYIGQCNGICIKKEKISSYRDRIAEVESFLKGNGKDLVEFLKNEMIMYSDKLEFEKAALYRDYMNDALALMEKQSVVLSAQKDMDIILVGNRREIILFNVEKGILSGREVFYLDGEYQDDKEALTSFIKQHYTATATGPRELIVEEQIEDLELIQEHLSKQWGFKVKIIREPKGEKKNLLSLAKSNAVEMIKLSEDRAKNKKKREKAIEDALKDILSDMNMGDGAISVDELTGEVFELFDKGNKPRIEAYDISNTNGVDNVGAMVCYRGYDKDKKSYRKFKIKYVQGQDDYGSMREVVERRIDRGLKGDKSFLPLPQIILVDGGKGHVNAVAAIVERHNLPIGVIGMVKDDRHRTSSLTYKSDMKKDFATMDLKQGSILYSYIGNIQEEVHRFAIGYHKSLREDSSIKSILDDINGIGVKKRNALLKYFGNIENIKKADIKELEEVPLITEANAKGVYEFFRGGEDQ